MKVFVNNVHTKFYFILCVLTTVYLIMAAGYYEICGATVSVALFVLYIWYYKKEKVFFYINDSFFSLILIPLCYIVSCLWAIDKTIAPWGIAKYFSIIMYTLCVMQLSNEDRRKLLYKIPYIAAIIVILSLILQFITVMKNQIIINGRLGGLFGYPNTLAIFLLIGIWISTSIESNNIKFVQLIIMVGLILTGSRTVFVIAVVFFIFRLVFLPKEKNNIIQFILIVIVALILALLLEQILGFSVVSHVSETISERGTSTFWGRILYFKDALKIVIKNPLGLGYLGYYFTQGSYQNGVYTVRWVHNDILQILLDIGWIPAFLFIIAVVHSLLSIQINGIQKGVITILLVHGFFDFNMEFVAMWFILILCMDLNQGVKKQFAFNHYLKTILIILGTCIIIISVYFGIVSSAVYAKNFDLVNKISPGNTFAMINNLTKTKNAQQMDMFSDEILSHNEYISLAWSAKARVAYNSGDLEKVFEYKEKAIECNRYEINEYIDYFNMLKMGYNVYLRAGDIDSAQICYGKIVKIQENLDNLKATTENLAWKIYTPPNLQMPEEYKQFILQGGEE